LMPVRPSVRYCMISLRLVVSAVVLRYSELSGTPFRIYTERCSVCQFEVQ
jgi:hypothetical protein